MNDASTESSAQGRHAANEVPPGDGRDRERERERDRLWWPSVLWTRAAGVPPVGEPWAGPDTRCVMCGSPIAAGEPAVAADRRKFDESFTYSADCKHPGLAACGHCLAIWNTRWMNAGAQAYAVEGAGVFKLSRDVDVAAFVLRPPKERYVAVYSTRKQAQMIWRTPVSRHSADAPVLFVRIDDQVVDIDTAHILQAWRAWRVAREALLARLEQIAPELGARARVYTPFVLARKMLDSRTGSTVQIHLEPGQPGPGASRRGPVDLAVEAAMHSSQARDAVEMLQALTAGEWWALRSLAGASAQDWSPEDPSTWPHPTPLGDGEDAAKGAEDSSAEASESEEELAEA